MGRPLTAMLGGLLTGISLAVASTPFVPAEGNTVAAGLVGLGLGVGVLVAAAVGD